jgi:hypothetical protein
MSTLTSSAHLRLTEFFILENPTEIALERPTRVATGTGGYTLETGESLEPFLARLVSSNRVGQGVTRTTTDGSVVTATHTLIAMPDEDIQIKDRFSIGANTYEVIGFADSPPWRISAEVYLHG